VLDLDETRESAPTKDAATLLLLRDGPDGPEIFCVERNRKSAFMGGAVVFPGGKVDDLDADASWRPLATPPHAAGAGLSRDEDHLRALTVAACRESLEEACILPVSGGTLGEAGLRELQAALGAGAAALRAGLEARKLALDLGALVPFARWITPVAESRRFDARFFIARAPEGQGGAHDEHETVSSFWATPRDVLARWEQGRVQLAPPTHRTLTVLGAHASVDAALTAALTASLAPICPRLVQHKDARGETLALVLPGDPQHDVPEARVPGPSRYVLRGEQWRSEDPPR
jgi:8-oxo-dGTP pyrophosphatase MutT (NUDIX family)